MPPRRTSRRRTNRRLVPNEIKFVQDITSPLDYEPSGYPKGAVQRLSLIDTEVADPAKPQLYFQEQRSERWHSVTGRKLKKPRIEIRPGAAPGTVSFIDYYVSGSPGDYDVYINFMSTRGDLRGKGHAHKLLATFVKSSVASGVTHMNFGRVLSPAVWKMYEELKAAYEKGESPLHVRAKKDF